MTVTKKEVVWVGSSRKDLSRFPNEVKEVMGYAIYQAQLGDKHPDAKPLKGFGGAGVLEIVDNSGGSTFRGAYTVWFPEFVYVLHAFQKKSVKGTATPQVDVDLIKERLKSAEDHYRRWKEETG